MRYEFSSITHQQFKNLMICAYGLQRARPCPRYTARANKRIATVSPLASAIVALTQIFGLVMLISMLVVVLI